MNTKETVIYALFDPRYPEDIRYVGKTINLQRRIYGHKKAAKAGVKCHVYNWINKLTREGIDFNYKILEVTSDDWALAESYWIRYYRELGHSLTNHTNGGEGQVGRKCSTESKLKMSVAKLGNKINEGRVQSEETKLKIKEAFEGKPSNKKPGGTGFKYVTFNKARNNYYVRIQYLQHNKYGFKTAEEANEYVQQYLSQLEVPTLQLAA